MVGSIKSTRLNFVPLCLAILSSHHRSGEQGIVARDAEGRVGGNGGVKKALDHRRAAALPPPPSVRVCFKAVCDCREPTVIEKGATVTVDV